MCGERATCEPSSHLDIGLFNQLSKFFKILLVDFAKFFGTDVARLAAQALELGLNIGQLIILANSA